MFFNILENGKGEIIMSNNVADTFKIVYDEEQRIQSKLLDGSLSMSNDPFDRLVADAYRRWNNKEHPNTTDFEIEGYSQGYFTIAMDQTLDWFGTDSLEQWYENVNNSKKKNLLQENDWIRSDGTPIPIEYRFNKLGFRDEEHYYDDSEPCILCIGMSDVNGVGMHIEDCWPTILGRAMGIKVYKMGVGLGSLDTAKRLYKFWKNRLKPENTFVSYSASNKRFEIDGKPVGPWHSKEAMIKLGVYDKYIDEEWKNARIKENFEYFRNEGVILATEKLSYEAYDDYDFLVDWYHNDHYAVTDTTMRNKPDFGRDLIHAGKRWHRLVAANYLEQI